MIKAVIFDLDDTLCNTSEVLEDALKKTFSDNLSHFPGKTVDEMLQLNDQAFKDTFLDPKISVPSAQIIIWFRIFELLNLKPQIKPILEIIDQVRFEIRKKINILPGTLDVLDYCKQKGIKLGLLTNGGFYEQAQKAILLGIDMYFDCFATPDITLFDKPNPGAFQYVLDKLKVKSSETFMVGDSVNLDIIGANTVKIPTVLLLGDRNYSREEQQKANFVISHLSELRAILEKG